jgi:hypothetical protein
MPDSSHLAITNDDLMGALNKKQLERNITEKLSKINYLREGADVLRNSDISSNPYVQGRINYLESEARDFEAAIKTWAILLDHLSTET